MEIIIITVLSILISIKIFIIRNLLLKNEKAEDIIISQNQFISKLHQTIIDSEKHLNEIDHKEIFKSDDEIGWFFEEIKKLQNNLSQFKTYDKKTK
jgi:hypothetical protein